MPVGWDELEDPAGVNMGNPHAVFFVPDCGAVPLTSLGPLIDFWTRTDSDASPACGAIARLVRDQVQDAPALAGAIADPAVLEQHIDLVDLLMSAEIPAALWEQAHGAAMVPLTVSPLDEVRKERIWREDSAVPAPGIVLAFKNTTGVVLEEGPAVVYDEGSYAGEAMLPFAFRDADLRVAFAMDLAEEGMLELVTEEETRGV